MEADKFFPRPNDPTRDRGPFQFGTDAGLNRNPGHVADRDLLLPGQGGHVEVPGPLSLKEGAFDGFQGLPRPILVDLAAKVRHLPFSFSLELLASGIMLGTVEFDGDWFHGVSAD